MKRLISPYVVGDITLRMLEERDLPLTLSWRNNPQTRVYFKNSEEISLESHKAWFDSYCRKNDDYVFIAESKDGIIGQLAVYDILNGTAEVGRFIVSPEMKGLGIMKRSIDIFLSFLMSFFNLNEIKLEVYKNNENAICLYRSLGFQVVGISEELIQMRFLNVKSTKNMVE